MSMPTRSPLLSLMVAVWLCLALPAGSAAAEVPAEAAGAEFFEKKIRPVLVEHCYRCHAADAKKLKGGLLLDSRSGLLKGGDNGPALVPGRPEKSRLIEAVHYQSVDLRMPPRGKLPDAILADLATWIKMGAPWPPGEGAKTTAGKEASFNLEQRKRSHWAWQPIVTQQPPMVRNTAWPRDPVDRFILAKLEEKGLHPAARADKGTLLRRVCFDLVGLPPTPEEVEAFRNDNSPNAYERVVDRLLASSHFGERWGRHWLDLVRYAETYGHEFDYVTPNAYQYRDYVIRALNADVPYNQIVVEHLAGDLLKSPRTHPVEGFNESILGTGFWFLGEEVHSPVDVRQDEADRFDNRIDVLGKTFLGLTVACARCHDHKFDAISTRDYYALFGIIESSSYRLARFDTMEQNRHAAERLQQLRKRSRPVLLKALAADVQPVVDDLAEYFLVARAALQAESGGEYLAELARSRKLDADLLERWVTYLAAAARDEREPLHAFARVAVDPAAKDAVHVVALLRPIAAGWRKRLEDTRAAWRDVHVVFDYGNAGPDRWLPDGVAFGAAPVQPGDVRFGSTTARPILEVCDRTAAVKDPTWDCLRVAPGTENDPGYLGATIRAGHIIRTPTFTLAAGKLFYLVRGTGRAYAAVAQHGLIAGPLHGQLVTPIKTGERYQWVGHNLTPYQGQRVHVEFTAEGADFAVAMVVQATVPPPAADLPNELLLRLLESGDATTVEKLAAAHQRLFADVVQHLCGDRLSGSPNAGAAAALANWLLHHPELFTSGGKRFGAAGSVFVAEQAKVTAGIEKESRLALAIMEGSGVDENVFIRGSPKAPGVIVPRRFLEALADPGRLLIAHGSGRLELARLMTDPRRNPFITRVFVNRVWQHLFGRGIVASVDNFGVLGERPTHPELLDYLAEQFVQDGWSLKRLVRSLVLSNTYCMAAQPVPEAEEADPQNLLLHRMRLRRLEGEAIRDAMLAVSGRLNERLYGPSVPVYLTAFQDGRGRPASGPLDGNGRRSVYLAVRRNFLSPLLLAFDTPIPFSTVGQRAVSNVPAQALILLNDPFVQQQAEVWAKRVLARGGSPRERISGMYLAAFGRPASAADLQNCEEFLERQARLGSRRPDDLALWTDLAHVLFNVKEFIFLG